MSSLFDFKKLLDWLNKNIKLFFIQYKAHVLILFLLLGSFLILMSFRNEIELSTAVVDDQLDQTLAQDPFERGQYYFNVSADPTGVYDLQKAREAYEEVIVASSTSHSIVWYQLGRIDFIEGRFDSALYKFQKQIAYFGDEFPSVYYMIGLTNGFKARTTNSPEDWQKGADGFKKYIELAPNSPWARTDLAWIYFSQGKFEEMTPILEEGLKYHPDHPWLHNMYGLALMNTGDKENAKLHFNKALEGAQKLSPEDWGRAYPGNDPALWGEGLESFVDAIKKNQKLVAG